MFNKNNKDFSIWNVLTKAQKEHLKQIKGNIEFLDDKVMSDNFSLVDLLSKAHKLLSSITSLKQMNENHNNLCDRWQERSAELSKLNEEIYKVTDENKDRINKYEVFDLIIEFFNKPTVSKDYGADALVIWMNDDTYYVSKYKVEKEMDSNITLNPLYCFPAVKYGKLNPNKLSPILTKSAFKLKDALKNLLNK